MIQIVTVALLIAQLIGTLALADIDQVSAGWIAFRYSSTEVLLYAGWATDTAGFTASDLSGGQISQPTAQWGGGGYLMPLDSNRFSALRLERPGEEAILHEFSPGAALTVRLGPKQKVSAVVEHLVEQWGGANPEVQVGVLARVKTEDLAKFRSNGSGYFLAYRGKSPAISTTPRRQEIVGRRCVLNDLGETGEIIVVKGDDGWNVALWRHFGDKFLPTNIAYSYRRLIFSFDPAVRERPTFRDASSVRTDW